MEWKASTRALVAPLGIMYFLLGFQACTRAYPYLIVTDDCRCEVYRYRDERNRVDVEFRATYEVRERISSTIDITFFNGSNDTLDLRQAFIVGTSRNVHYQYNGRALPLPHVVVPPQKSYSMTLEGTDTETVPDPWLKIAGERVRIEIKSLLLGDRTIPPLVVDMVPRNPKLSL